MTEKDSELPAHILHPRVHWSRAIGYLKLEMFEQAETELQAFPNEPCWDKRRRTILVQIWQSRENWEEMRKFAHGLRIEFPENVDWWIADAYATRRTHTIEEAREILLEGLVHHYENATIRFNLACYACKLGSKGECLDFLKEAAKRDERYKLMAMEDEDLEDVHAALLKLGWGNTLV